MAGFDGTEPEKGVLNEDACAEKSFFGDVALLLARAPVVRPHLRRWKRGGELKSRQIKYMFFVYRRRGPAVPGPEAQLESSTPCPPQETTTPLRPRRRLPAIPRPARSTPPFAEGGRASGAVFPEPRAACEERRSSPGRRCAQPASSNIRRVNLLTAYIHR